MLTKQLEQENGNAVNECYNKYPFCAFVAIGIYEDSKKNCVGNK